MDLKSLLCRYAANPAIIFEVFAELENRLADEGDPAIWISRVPWDWVLKEVLELEKKFRSPQGGWLNFPLYGMPFAVKDNINVADMDTTAGCRAFAYRPQVSAPVVTRLQSAGAILIGKTNMDQFATGLVGTRSPYGDVRNPFHPEFISGGSSSGSAVAVALGLVSFALSTDTAGSGRVPAGFNNVVGIKPTRGVISARGVFPACKSLDCVSIFASTSHDAFKVLGLCRGVDPLDVFSRPCPAEKTEAGFGFHPGYGKRFTYGIPDYEHLEFFGDDESALLFREAEGRLAAMGGSRVEIPFAPFAEAARLLYEGPWRAEREVAFGAFLASSPEEVLPVIRKVMAGAKALSATDGFRAYYRLRELKRVAAKAFQHMDFMVTPTAPTHYARVEVEADPIALNSRLGYYTNFVNLLDLCAVAVPSGRKKNGLPFGVTFIAPAFSDGLLATFASDFHEATGLTLGASTHPIPAESKPTHSLVPISLTPQNAFHSRVRLAVAGLHLTGQPLNSQLIAINARLDGTFKTAPCYRLYALNRPGRHFPGLIRQTAGGGAIEVEVWEMSQASLGGFMENVREPLCIGTIELQGGEKVKGFLCEPAGIMEGVEITQFGGWLAYLADAKRGP